MLPLRDLNPTRPRFVPFVNYLLIAANVGVWLMQLALMQAGAAWVVPGYGIVPSRFTSDPLGEAFTVVTSMFMHGGWGHLGGNMLMLYIFGDNVEDAVGHLRYALFYCVSGLCAALAQVLIDPGSAIPMVGASGAISGVLGAYLVLYPRAPVTVLNPLPPLWLLFGPFLVFPAWLVVGEWFVFQLLQAIGSLGMTETGGVAFFAHLGGFIGGLLLIRPTMRGRTRGESRRGEGWRPPPRGGGGGHWAGQRRWPERPRDPWDRGPWR